MTFVMKVDRGWLHCTKHKGTMFDVDNMLRVYIVDYRCCLLMQPAKENRLNYHERFLGTEENVR